MEKKYKRRKALAEKYGISVQQVDKKITWILKHPDLYPHGSVIHIGKTPYISEDAFGDAMINAGKLDHDIR